MSVSYSVAPHLGELARNPALPLGRKMRVLHIIHSVCHGGIESALINWVRFLDRERMDVHVACFAFDRNREAAFVKAAGHAGIPLLYIPWAVTKPFLKAARWLARTVRELGIDVIHTHSYYGDALGSLTKLFVKVKVVSTVYVWGKYEFHRQLMQAIDWTALRFVDKVTAHCEETLRLTLKLGFSKEKVSTLIAGFPVQDRPHTTPETRMRMRHEAGIADDEILMVNVARLHPEKAHDQLIRSFKLVHDQFPKTRLWISGTGWDWLERDLKKLRGDLHLDQAVEFVGFKQDLWPMLTMADMMTHSSHVEGVPVAILYGMAAGLPIVVSDVGSLYEIIDSKRQRGVRVAENDVDGFAREIAALIRDPHTRARMGASARHFVETDYSIQTAVQRVEQTYYEVLGV